MSYTMRDFKTKKELKEALKAGEKLCIYNPGLGEAPQNGKAFLEGPHYPKAHTWYAEVEMKDGIIVKVK